MEEKEFDKNLKKIITSQERKLQKKYLRSIEASLINTNKSKKFNWLIAASIGLFIGLGSYLFLFNNSLSNEEIYNTYFSPYANVVEPIVRDKVNLSKKAEAFSLYERGEYKKAIKSFNLLSDKDSINTATLNFYKANTYIKLNEFEKAKNLFHKVIESNSKEWKQESMWYLALIDIKLNNIDTAKTHLQNLQKQNKQAFKTEEIKTILSNLK